jgi:GNAT superfamily N-acetyltransferase
MKMTVDYRTIRSEEVPALLDLWGQGSAAYRAYQAARFASDSAACDHTYVAVLADGTIVSTIHYLVSRRWDATGQLRLVGEIDSVGTRPEARRQGHAQRLLLLVLAALLREGCDWSFLNSSEMARSLYERQGWRYFPERWRMGTVVGAAPRKPAPYFVRPFDPRNEPEGWSRLATVDMAFNSTRPLSVLRDGAYWQNYAAQRVANWIATEGLIIFAAFRSADDLPLCGYAMAEFNPGVFFQIRNLAVLPSETGAISALLHAVAQEGKRRGDPPVGRLFLPKEPAIDAALEQMFGATLVHGQNVGSLMARTIGVRFTDQQLDALFSASRAILSDIDFF